MSVEDVQTIQESPKKLWCGDSAQSVTTSGCFDCNICLDFAVEPVVTLCGHLYCWPCIYKWLHLESTTPPQCPVCKAALSQTTLVPLYGRGNSSGSEGSHHDGTINIPRRPSIQHRGQTMAASLIEPGSPRSSSRLRHRHAAINNNMLSMGARVFHPVLGGTAVAVLPWVFGDHIGGTGLYYSNPYYLVGSGESPRMQRQEAEVRRSLQRISVFLFFCVILCLLLF